MTAGFLGEFLPQWFKGTSVLCSPGRRRDGQRQGSEAVQSHPPPHPRAILPDASWTAGRQGCRYLGAYGMGEFQRWWGIRVHRLKVNVPYQHKKEHMSSVVPNCCHIEQFKHLIWTETHPERNWKSIGRLRRTLTWVLLRTAASQEEADVPQCAETWVRYVPRGRCVLLKNEASVRVRALPLHFTFQQAGCEVATGSFSSLKDAYNKFISHTFAYEHGDKSELKQLPSWHAHTHARTYTHTHTEWCRKNMIKIKTARQQLAGISKPLKCCCSSYPVCFDCNSDVWTWKITPHPTVFLDTFQT